MARPESSSAPAPVVTATKARQGALGADVFWVLVISVVLAAVAADPERRAAILGRRLPPGDRRG